MKYRGILLIFFALVAIFSITCSLQREVVASDADGNLTPDFVTVWPPEHWPFFLVGLAAAGAALWIMATSARRKRP